MNLNGENKAETKKRKGVINFLPLSFLKGSPIAKEQKTDEGLSTSGKYPIIPFFTKYNDFALELSLFAEVVPEHRGAIKSKKRWSLREPLSVERGSSGSLIRRNQSDREEVTEEELDRVEEFISSVNPSGENIKEILDKVINDLETVGNGYIEFVRGEVAGERFFYLIHHDATTALLMRRGENGQELTVGFCSDWSLVGGFGGSSKVEVIELPLYKGDSTEWKRLEGAERSVLHLKQYSTGRYYYGLPESIASLLAQKIGFEISRHNLDRLESDFFPRVFMEFFNTDGMSEQMQDEHLRSLINTFTKRSKDRIGVFAQYNEGESSRTNIHKLELDNKGDFIQLDQKKRQDILTAHSIPPILAGVQTTGSLGSSKEVRELFELFNNTVIAPLQNFLTDNLLRPYMKEASEYLEEMEDLSLKMETTSPLAFMGDLEINSILTINEGRKSVGLGEMKIETESGEMERDPRGERIINDQNSGQ